MILNKQLYICICIWPIRLAQVYYRKRFYYNIIKDIRYLNEQTKDKRENN